VTARRMKLRKVELRFCLSYCVLRQAAELPLRHFAYPFDRKIKGGGLIFYPLSCFIMRGAALLGGCASGEAVICAGQSALTDKGGDKFIGAAWLDPTEEAATRFHEVKSSKMSFAAPWYGLPAMLSISCHTADGPTRL
jgi:hypothetical protein